MPMVRRKKNPTKLKQIGNSKSPQGNRIIEEEESVNESEEQVSNRLVSFMSNERSSDYGNRRIKLKNRFSKLNLNIKRSVMP